MVHLSENECQADADQDREEDAIADPSARRCRREQCVSGHFFAAWRGKPYHTPKGKARGAKRCSVCPDLDTPGKPFFGVKEREDGASGISEE
jgi:hypothetical protein